MKCLNCDNSAIVTKAGKQSNFCSLSCRSKFNSAKTLEKRKQTNIDRYGVENPSKSSTIIATRSASNVLKYGVENPFSLREIQQKQQETMIARYGVPFASQSPEFKEKQIAIWNNNYGSHPWANENIRLKRRDTLLQRYGVEHPILCDEILTKIRDTCKQRYGSEIASKSQIIIDKIREVHLTELVKEKTRNTCIEKFGATSYQLSLIPAGIRELLDNKEQLGILANSYGITGLSEFLDVSVDTIRDRLRKHEIQLSFKSSIQQEITEYIRSLGVTEMIIDSRKVIPPKELDLYFGEKRFAIEVNGSYWHSELNGRNSDYHLSKLSECTNKNIKLFFVWEHLWNTKKDIVKSRISNKFKKNTKIYARRCQIVHITKKEKKEFLENNHLQGDCGSSVEYGLIYEGKLCAVMTFGNPRFNNTAEWELLRFATSKTISVIGGASRLFRYFIKTMAPASVISYSDRQYGSGDLYRNLGFSYVSSSPPNYFYTRDYKYFEGRLKYQKHKLAKLLPDFNPDFSEWENMKNNGYDRIWDCGNDVWVWKT